MIEREFIIVGATSDKIRDETGRSMGIYTYDAKQEFFAIIELLFLTF
jgi:hypothetical protein